MNSSRRTKIPRLALTFAVVVVSVLPHSRISRAEDDCSTYRMDAPGESMEHVQARDQDRLGICFAETGAQTADAIRFSRLKDTDGGQYKQTSGKGVALGISEIMGVNSLAHGGGTCWALNHINKYGICDQASIEEAPAGQQLTAADGETGRPLTMDDANNALVAASAADNWERRVFQPVQLAPGVTGFQGQCLPPSSPQSGLDGKQLENVGNALTQLGTLTDNARAVMNACKRTNPFKNVKLTCEVPKEEKTAMAPDPSAIKSNILSLLNPRADGKSRLPIEIHFCSVILDKGGLTNRGSLNGNRGRSNGGTEDACGAHASLVIGRKKDAVTGKCQLLVRNSWGTDCDYYSEQINAENRCEGNGNVWLDADYLSKNTLGVVAPPEL